MASGSGNQIIEEILKDLEQSAGNFSDWLQALLTDKQGSGQWDKYGGSVKAAYTRLKSTIGQAPDVVLRQFTIGPQRTPALIAFEDGQVDNAILDRDTLMLAELAAPGEADAESLFTAIQTHFNAVGHVTTSDTWSTLISSMFLGMTLLFIEGVANVLMLDTVKFPSRPVSRAQSEPSVKGPQEAFNEILLTQMNVLRRHLPSPDLAFEPFTIGTESHSTIIVAYLQYVANPNLVRAVKERVGGIQRASVQTSNEIGEYLADRRFTIFPQIRLSDRVDLIARNIAQGKVAVLCANDPTALILPNTLMDFYQTTQDYAFPFWDGTLMRAVRLIGLVVGLYLMPLYIALSSINPDLFPVKLLLTVDGSRQGIPFPPVIEVVIMWVIIEILREAANRLPQQLATTIGTVGAVVVGTAIVKAGLVDAIMIIIVTLTALGLFTVPAIEMASTWRWMFWAYIVAAWIFGVYGVVLITVVTIIHLTSLENYGLPYLSPFAPLRARDLMDSWVRFPFTALRERPQALRTLDPIQASPNPIDPKVDLHLAQKNYLQ